MEDYVISQAVMTGHEALILFAEALALATLSHDIRSPNTLGPHHAVRKPTLQPTLIL